MRRWQRLECVARLLERVAALDRDPECACLQEGGHTFQVRRHRLGHDVEASSSVTRGAERRGEPPSLFEDRSVRRLGYDIQDRIDAIGMALTHCRREVGVPVEELTNPDPAQVVAILGERGSDHIRARGSGELDEEGADATGGADDEHGLARCGRQRVKGRDRSDCRQRGGAGLSEIDAAGLRRGIVCRDRDQLGPTPVADGRVRVEDEAEDFVAD